MAAADAFNNDFLISCPYNEAFIRHRVPTAMSRYNQGFSLLQLALSMVVVGMLFGSIFVGADLIRGAQLTKIITQLDAYVRAVNVFQDRYHELPGDMSNAESYWGSDSTCPTTAYTATPHAKTCNGNGNGHIGDLYTDGGTSSYEIYRMWQQLADASLIEGAYNGISGNSGSGNESLPTVNVPMWTTKNSGFTMLYVYRPAGDGSYWPLLYGHVLIFGNKVTNAMTYGPVLTPREAFKMDGKVDDGRPAYGKVMTFKSALVPNCTTSDTATASAYNLTYDDLGCSLIFITGF